MIELEGVGETGEEIGEIEGTVCLVGGDGFMGDPGVAVEEIEGHIGRAAHGRYLDGEELGGGEEETVDGGVEGFFVGDEACVEFFVILGEFEICGTREGDGGACDEQFVWGKGLGELGRVSVDLCEGEGRGIGCCDEDVIGGIEEEGCGCKDVQARGGKREARRGRRRLDGEAV